MCRGLRLRTIGIIAVAAFCATSVLAQSGKIARLRATGSKKVGEAQIVEASGLKAGEVITKEDIQGAADRLAQLGPFQNVRYKFQTTKEGVEVEFQLEDAPTVAVSFDNFVTFSDQELGAALRQVDPFYDGTTPQQGVVLDAMTDALRKLVAARGIKADVERTLLLGPGDEGNIMQFKIAAPAMRVKSVEFGDAIAAQSTKLAEPLRALIGKPFSRYSIDLFLFEQVRPLYAQRGLLKVHFGVPQARFAGNPNQPLPDEVSVFVPIEPGKIYLFGSVTWKGNSVLDAAALNGFLGLAQDEVADGMKLTGGWDRIRLEYGRRGYLEASVTPQESFDDAKGVVSYTVAVKEGIQYRMGQFVITGLSIPAERKLLAVWRLATGEVFDQVYFEDFLEKQARLKGAFGDYVVTYTTVGHFLRTNPQTGVVDVLLDFK